MRQSRSGFTIVELLIVIVVIAILAAITTIAFNGVQQRARDSQREHDITTIRKAIDLFRADKGGYPVCGTANAYSAGGALAGSTASNCLTAALVPTYLAKLPTDPINSGSYQYFYGNGYRRTSATTYTGDQTDNYIFATKKETSSASTFSAFGRTDLNVLLGSAN